MYMTPVSVYERCQQKICTSTVCVSAGGPTVVSCMVLANRIGTSYLCVYAYYNI